VAHHLRVSWQTLHPGYQRVTLAGASQRQSAYGTSDGASQSGHLVGAVRVILARFDNRQVAGGGRPDRRSTTHWVDRREHRTRKRRPKLNRRTDDLIATCQLAHRVVLTPSQAMISTPI